MRRSIAVALLLLAVLQLGFRGMQRVRSDVPMWDFASVYASARTWLHGGDPYDLPRVAETWRQGGAFAERSVSTWALVYPPNSLVMVAPLAVLPSGAALVAWLFITLVLLAWQFAALKELAQLRWSDARTWLLVGASLAAAPFQFGILSGQLSMPASSLCIIAFCYVSRGRVALAGALLGLACAIKPQVGAPFVAYYLVLRQFNVAKAAMLVAGIIGAGSLSVIQLTHPGWLAEWTANIAASSQLGGVNDYSWAGPFRDEIMDLKLLLVSIPHDPMVLRIAIGCIVMALLAWFIRSYVHRDTGRNTARFDLLALAAFSAVVLLPIYHRVYDAALLTTALAWALAELDGPKRRWALAMLFPMMLFLVPFDFVRSIGYRLPGITQLSETWWWQALVAPHYAWGLLALTIGLLATLSRHAISRPAALAAAQPATAANLVLATSGAGGVDADDDEEIMLAH